MTADRALISTFDRQFEVGTRGWNATECRVTCCLQTTQNPANIHQSMIWSDDDNNQAALPQKASHFCLQSCELLRTHTSLGRWPERENMLAALHMRVAIRPNSHSRDFSNSSRKIRKLASFSRLYLIFRIKLLSDPLISIKELIIFNIIYQSKIKFTFSRFIF